VKGLNNKKSTAVMVRDCFRLRLLVHAVFHSVQCLLCSRFKLFTRRTSPCRCRSFYRASLVKQRSSLHCHARRDMIHSPGNLSFIHRSPNVLFPRLGCLYVGR